MNEAYHIGGDEGKFGQGKHFQRNQGQGPEHKNAERTCNNGNEILISESGLGFFSGRLFPSTPLKPFTIILKFCYFLVFPTQNPLFLNQNVLDTRDESKESQENLTID